MLLLSHIKNKLPKSQSDINVIQRHGVGIYKSTTNNSDGFKVNDFKNNCVEWVSLNSQNSFQHNNKAFDLP